MGKIGEEIEEVQVEPLPMTEPAPEPAPEPEPVRERESVPA